MNEENIEDVSVFRTAEADLSAGGGGVLFTDRNHGVEVRGSGEADR